MRVHLRRLHPGEPDHELIWLAVTTLAAVASSVWLALQLPWPRCTFRALLGIPCLTCGSTRAALALMHGHLDAAWTFNPLATLALCAIVAFDVYALAVLTGRAPRVRVSLGQRQHQRLFVGLLFSAALLNWCYLLLAHR